MKKIVIIALLSTAIGSAWSAAGWRLDFVLGEKIAKSLEKILATYKPEFMIDHSIRKNISLAIEAAKEGNTARAKSYINLIIKSGDAQNAENYQRNTPFPTKLITMLNKASLGEDPY